MKNLFKFLGIIALVAVIGFSMAGCKTEDEGDGNGDGNGGGVVSTMSAPGINEIANIPFESGVPPISTMTEARSLLNGLNTAAGNLGNILSSADWDAFDRAFRVKHNDSLDGFIQQQKNNKSVSYSLNINDNAPLKETISTVLTGNIKGSNNASISLNNQALAVYLSTPVGLKNKDDNVSMSISANRTFTIDSGYIGVSYGGTTYKVSGIVKMEYSAREKSTLKDSFNSIETGSYSEVSKVSAALVVSNGTRAAKFRFSVAEEGNTNARSIDQSSSYNCSDVEVYNQLNQLILTIPASEISTYNWSSLAQNFAYGGFGTMYGGIRNNPIVPGGTGTESNPIPLTVGNMANGSITSIASNSAVWYSFSVTSGTSYYVWWDDADNSDHTLDVKIAAYYSNGNNIFDSDSNYQLFTASSAGTVKIKIYPYSSGNTGTFAVGVEYW